MSAERIKKWPTKERPRERLLAEGPERLTDAERRASQAARMRVVLV